MLANGALLKVTGSGQSANGYTFVPVRIQATGLTGWVADQYIRETTAAATSTPTSTTPTPSPIATETTTAGPSIDLWQVVTGLNLRAGAGTSFPVIRILQRNEIVEVTGSGVTAGSYFFVPVRAVNDNATGWVAQQYLDRAVSTSGDASPAIGTVSGSADSTQVPIQVPGSLRIDNPVLRWIPEYRDAETQTGVPAEPISPLSWPPNRAATLVPSARTARLG